MRLEFHPATVTDVNDASDYYRQNSPRLAAAFREQLNAAFARIAENPFGFPIIEGNIRRCIVQRFPYSILFRIRDDNKARVLVIRHHKRNPQVGMNRK